MKSITTITHKITLTKAEREVLTNFERMIDDMDLSAEELESLLWGIYWGKKSDDNGILIEYEND